MNIDDNFWPAIYLTTLSGLSTCLGGIFVIFNGKPTFKNLGCMLSFSAGVMLFISFMDLLPDSVEAIGFSYANYYVRNHLCSMIFSILISFSSLGVYFSLFL